MGDVPLNMGLDNLEFGTLVADAGGIVTFSSRRLATAGHPPIAG